MMQSIVMRSGRIDKALVYLPATYHNCVAVFDRLTGEVKTLTTPCSDGTSYGSMLENSSIGNYALKYPRGR